MKLTNAIRTGMLFIVVLLTTITGYSQQSARDLQVQIEDLNKQMVSAMLEGNTEKSLSFYADDAISLPSYEPILQGISEIRKANEDMAKSGMKINSYEPTILKVIPNGDMVTEIGTYKINLNVPGMDQPIDDHGKYLTIWEKQPDGSLKVKVETWNSDTNPMMQMQQQQK